MNRNKLWVILMVIIIILAIILIINLVKKDDVNNGQNQVQQEEFTIQTENGNKVNTSEALKKPREELGYNVSNITLEKQDAQTIFKLQLSNQTNADKPGQLVDIVFIDKSGNEESRMALYIREIKAGASIETQATINNDFTNVYDFKLETRN